MADTIDSNETRALPSNNVDITRRDVLKLITIGAATAVGVKITSDITLDSLLAGIPKSVDEQIPEEFKSVEIPKNNELYQPPEDILQEAFTIYDMWRERSDLPPITFSPHRNYLDVVNLAKKFPNMFSGNPGNLENRLVQVFFEPSVEESIDATLNEDNFAFSAFAIDGIKNLMQLDPGSGIVRKAVSKATDFKGWTRKEFYQKLWRGEVDNATLELCRTEVSDTLLNAKRYFESVQTKQSEPQSMSLVIAYFLHHNRGDLYESMWDSTLFMKMLARNNLSTLQQEANHNQAVDIAILFKDQFSPHISHNWLIDKFRSGIVPKNSQLLLAGAMQNEKGKSFMPINTAGVYYHGLNIMTWAAVCMDPLIVEAIVAGYYNAEKFGSKNFKTEHGREKITADIQVAMHANQIKKVVERNIKT